MTKNLVNHHHVCGCKTDSDRWKERERGSEGVKKREEDCDRVKEIVSSGRLNNSKLEMTIADNDQKFHCQIWNVTFRHVTYFVLEEKDYRAVRRMLSSSGVNKRVGDQGNEDNQSPPKAKTMSIKYQ